MPEGPEKFHPSGFLMPNGSADAVGRNVLNVGGLLQKSSSFLVLPGFFSARTPITGARWLLL